MSNVSFNMLVVQQQRTGWLCPKCGGAHGPHVDTCPALQPAVSGLPTSPTILPTSFPHPDTTSPTTLPTHYGYRGAR